MRVAGIIVTLSVLVTAVGTAHAVDKAKEGKNPVVVMETSKGTVKIELWPDKAPITAKNFLRYVDEKFYDDTIFHRVISTFMIQGGGFTKDMNQKKTHEQIKNEAANGCENKRGTVAMARTNVVDSATAQFFINVKDNTFLNHKNESPQGFGYCVFGEVIEGMDVVDKIKDVKTKAISMYVKDVPVKPVVIKSIRQEKKTEEKMEKKTEEKKVEKKSEKKTGATKKKD